MPDKPDYTIDATETSLNLLETLVNSEGAMGVTALAERLDVSKSVAHNHLSTLRDRGYVIKQGSTYEPSLRALNLGVVTRKQMPLFQAAKHQIDNLCSASSETTSLFVVEETVGVPVYISEASEGWSPQYTEGQRLPLHVNAPGKAILASLNDTEVDTILQQRELVKMTSATITDPDELKDKLQGIRDNNVAFCRGEQYEGIVGIATPLTTSGDGRAAALGICGPVDRLNGRYLEEDITGQVISTANSIQVDLRSMA